LAQETDLWISFAAIVRLVGKDRDIKDSPAAKANKPVDCVTLTPLRSAKDFAEIFRFSTDESEILCLFAGGVDIVGDEPRLDGIGLVSRGKGLLSR
jgi:hypothetical protein